MEEVKYICTNSITLFLNFKTKINTTNILTDTIK